MSVGNAWRACLGRPVLVGFLARARMRKCARAPGVADAHIQTRQRIYFSQPKTIIFTPSKGVKSHLLKVSIYLHAQRGREGGRGGGREGRRERGRKRERATERERARKQRERERERQTRKHTHTRTHTCCSYRWKSRRSVRTCRPPPRPPSLPYVE